MSSAVCTSGSHSAQLSFVTSARCPSGAMHACVLQVLASSPLLRRSSTYLPSEQCFPRRRPHLSSLLRASPRRHSNAVYVYMCSVCVYVQCMCSTHLSSSLRASPRRHSNAPARCPEPCSQSLVHRALFTEPCSQSLVPRDLCQEP